MQSLRGGLRPRVLLVEDDEESRHLLRELLEAEEVAVEMSISVKTVYSKKHKLLARLQTTLAPLVAA